jgi:hypothetical protein
MNGTLRSPGWISTLVHQQLGGHQVKPYAGPPLWATRAFRYKAPSWIYQFFISPTLSLLQYFPPTAQRPPLSHFAVVLPTTMILAISILVCKPIVMLLTCPLFKK